MVASAVATVLVLVVAALGAMILYRALVSGRVFDLLADRPGGAADPERIQMVAFALASAAAYGAIGIRKLPEIAAAPALPDVPEWLLAVAGASQLLYLAGKVGRRR
ncbi:MAG TPA: hypothetical protein VJ924_14885 [Alphaproteobacteria bacterium]|nr:hypothetical protein [Alphaproteobacteria bacterium]